jgi:hypothetical protein
MYNELTKFLLRKKVRLRKEKENIMKRMMFD